MTAEPVFDFERARQYWRHVPAGAQKLDTGGLSDPSSAEAIWDRAFRSRLSGYPEEDQFIRRFSPRCAGRRIVSIGSGLGFHELFYAASGADVTCCDIVATNLDLIAAVARAKDIGVTTFYRPDLTAEPLPARADVVFIYGCLMHMPPDAQRRLLSRARAALTASGSIVLMVYAWEFVRRTCGWNDPSHFDPVIFARASDPAVDGEACPWSDWHDDRKLLELAGDGASIVRRQSWNDDQFLWYELDYSGRRHTLQPFFDDDAAGEGETVASIDGGAFIASNAAVSRSWHGVKVSMRPSRADYAVTSPTFHPARGANAVVVDLTLRSGALSVGLLDESAQRFVSVAVRTRRGRHRIVLMADPIPDPAAVVISNHQPLSPATGTFVLRGARIQRREPLSVRAASATGRCSA